MVQLSHVTTYTLSREVILRVAFAGPYLFRAAMNELVVRFSTMTNWISVEVWQMNTTKLDL